MFYEYICHWTFHICYLSTLPLDKFTLYRQFFYSFLLELLLALKHTVVLKVSYCFINLITKHKVPTLFMYCIFTHYLWIFPLKQWNGYMKGTWCKWHIVVKMLIYHHGYHDQHHRAGPSSYEYTTCQWKHRSKLMWSRSQAQVINGKCNVRDQLTHQWDPIPCK